MSIEKIGSPSKSTNSLFCADFWGGHRQRNGTVNVPSRKHAREACGLAPLLARREGAERDPSKRKTFSPTCGARLRLRSAAEASGSPMPSKPEGRKVPLDETNPRLGPDEPGRGLEAAAWSAGTAGGRVAAGGRQGAASCARGRRSPTPRAVLARATAARPALCPPVAWRPEKGESRGADMAALGTAGNDERPRGRALARPLGRSGWGGGA